MMDGFSNFTVAVVTPNQQAKTVVKTLVDCCSTPMGYHLESIVMRANHLIIR